MRFVRTIAIFLIIALCPLFGTLYYFKSNAEDLTPYVDRDRFMIEIDQSRESINRLLSNSVDLLEKANQMKASIDGQSANVIRQDQLLNEMISNSNKQKALYSQTYEKYIYAPLGRVIDSHVSSKAEIKLYEVVESNYRGYIAKVKLFNPSALKVSLGEGELGKAETTSAAVKRENAIFGVNAGGFFFSNHSGTGLYYPVGNTMLDGRLIENFKIPSEEGLFFSGFTRDGRLVGGIYNSHEELLRSGAYWGTSFVPILIQDRQTQTIPGKWRNSRQPRTIVGNLHNGDLFFMVIDGRQPGWSNGATLEEMQRKLKQLGAISAYNLDGGGSTTMVFKDKVVNRPSDGKERLVVTNILISK